MSRYAAMFDRLGSDGAFGAFLMLGDPDLKTSAALLDALKSRRRSLKPISQRHWKRSRSAA